MGDSEASTDVVTSQVIREEGATIQSVTKHTVTSVETSHMESSQESVVHVESVVQEASASSSSVTQQEVSQTHSITATASSGEETIAVEEAPAPPPAIEPQPVDENANSIPDEPAAVAEPTPVSEPAVEPIPEPPPQPAAESAPEPAPEPAAEPAPEHVAEPAPEPVAEPAPEPVVEPAPEPVAEPAPEPVVEPAPEPVPEPEPIPEAAPEPEVQPPSVEETKEEVIPAAVEISQENIKTQLHEIISEIEQEVLPDQDEVKETAEVEVISLVEETKPVKEEEEAKPVGESQPVVEPQPVEVPQPVAESQPVAEPQPFVEPQLVDGHMPPEFQGEMEKYEYYDEDGTLHHTWRPRIKYNVKKTEILYEDIVPIQVPDISLSQQQELLAKQARAPAPPAPLPHEEIAPPAIPNNVEGLTNGGFDQGDLHLVGIPEGIPLLARVLPKTDQGLEGDKKISLERLFTPATDSGDLTPIKKKAFASSAFYRPDHPTIDDQVELAQRISFSLVDDHNKMSRGQSMYIKRKNRSMRWIHQGEEGDEDYEDTGMEMMEDDICRPPEKPAMKLLMSSKGVQDCHQVQEHYQNLLNQAAPHSPEVNKIVTEISSPTGKGAELFAKRKKRMDKFIVDETTVQKSQQTSMTQQSSSSSFSSLSSSNVSSSQNISSGFSVAQPAVAPGAGAMYTAEVKVVQRASLPPTPIDVKHHSLLDLVTEESTADKRRSASFNLAAKGFGTYNTFYTPVTFATKS